MPVVKINAIEFPAERGPELERRFARQRRAMDGVPGFLGFEMLRPTAGESRYFIVTRWDTDESFQAWRTGGHRDGAHDAERAREPQQRVGSDSSTLEFDVVDLDAIAASDES